MGSRRLKHHGSAPPLADATKTRKIRETVFLVCPRCECSFTSATDAEQHREAEHKGKVKMVQRIARSAVLA